MIQAERLRLWPLEHCDLGKNYQWANDMELCRYAGALPMPKSLNELEGWYNSANSNPETSIFAIKLNDGAYIGNIEIRNLDLRCANCELGIILGEASMRGKGYGQEAVMALCGFVFDQLRLHKVTVHVLEFNERAAHMFTKCGFIQEGTERESFWSDGHYWDVRIFSILESEFRLQTAKSAASQESGIK